jgi:antitoxin (DNA-binding transcriptional repressor) of toxin-antitoxin stability system
MRTISPLDLRRSLGQILDAASAGERFLIERDHHALAMLVSIEDGNRLDESGDELYKRRMETLDLIDARRELLAITHPRPPGVPEAAELIRQERSRDDPDGYPEYPEDERG